MSVSHFADDIKYSCIDTYAHSCLKPLSNERRPCSNNQIRIQTRNSRAVRTKFLLENPQDGPRFVCMTFCGKTLRPGISILFMLLLTTTLLAE